MANNKLRVAVVGGGIGVSHIKGYQQVTDMFDLVALCDIDEPKAKALAAEYNIPEVVTSFDKLIARPDLDVIDICTPPHLHFQMIKKTLQAGKHAICEKPLVESVALIDELKQVEAQSGKRMMPIFQY